MIRILMVLLAGFLLADLPVHAAEAMLPNWQKEPEWVHTGSDRPYHSYSSAIWLNRIGKAMGEARLELRTNPR